MIRVRECPIRRYKYATVFGLASAGGERILIRCGPSVFPETVLKVVLPPSPKFFHHFEVQ